MMPVINLSKRLTAVAGLLPSCACIVDVGCDHGKLGLYLLLTNQCHTLIASDVSEPSLSKAKRNFQACGVEQRAQCLVYDGLPESGVAQAAAIAGIGGSNTLSIVQRGIHAAANMQRLVLQPSDDAAVLRRGLWNLGFAFDSETVVYEKRYFPVMAVHYDGVTRPPLDELTCEIGPCNRAHPGAHIIDYVNWRISVWEKTVETPAQTKAGRRNQQMAKELITALKQWRKENVYATDT